MTSPALTGKQAIVFLLDTHSSMNSVYSSSAGGENSRLDCAKEALESWISDLMIQSKQNEVGVVVLKTADTSHHLDEDDFPNLTFLPDRDGVTRPTIQMLRQIQEVCCSSNDDSEPRGDLMDGLIIAADALRRRTLGKKYHRSIVILTDAFHEVVIVEEQVLKVVDSLREMNCKLHVVGLDFEESAIFEEALPESGAAVKIEDESIIGSDDSKNGSTDVEDDKSRNDSADDDETIESNYDDNDAKRDTERFLISVARLTGGSVRAAHSLQQMLEQSLGKRIPASTRRKCQFCIAPSIDPIEVRVSLLLSKTNLPTLKKEAVLLGEENKPLIDGLGNPVTSELQVVADHFDAVEKEIGVGETGRTKAVRYGADWIPLNDFDLQGLKQQSEIKIVILGYIDQSKISRGFCMGPPYGISGADSIRASTALSALAQAMHRLSSCAICTYVKSQNADPILTAVFPQVMEEIENSQEIKQHRLVLLQLPFCGDVQKLTTESLQDFCTPEKQEVCDQVIDSMMLPKGVLESDRIPNPAIRSFRKTVVQRAIHPSTKDIIPARGDWFNVPNFDQSALKQFRQTFPIQKAKQKGKGSKTEQDIYDPFADSQENE